MGQVVRKARTVEQGNLRMVSDLVTSNEPVCDERVICVAQRGIISDFGRTAIRICTLSKKLVDGSEGVGLNSIVRRVDNKLRDLRLPGKNVRTELSSGVNGASIFFSLRGTRTRT